MWMLVRALWKKCIGSVGPALLIYNSRWRNVGKSNTTGLDKVTVLATWVHQWWNARSLEEPSTERDSQQKLLFSKKLLRSWWQEGTDAADQAIEDVVRATEIGPSQAKPFKATRTDWWPTNVYNFVLTIWHKQSLSLTCRCRFQTWENLWSAFKLRPSGLSIPLKWAIALSHCSHCNEFMSLLLESYFLVWFCLQGAWAGVCRDGLPDGSAETYFGRSEGRPSLIPNHWIWTIPHRHSLVCSLHILFVTTLFAS